MTLLSVIALLIGSATPDATAASSGGTSPAILMIPPLFGGGTFHTDGPAVCNCTSAGATLSVCHLEEVSVDVGNSVITISTGQSSSSCASQDVPPGNCLYFRYNFDCTYHWWSGWSCHFISASAHARPADNSTDC